MKNRFWQIFGKIIGVVVVLAGILVLSIPPAIYYFYRRSIYVSIDSVKNNPATAMVLGAAVYPDDTPSSALQERLNMVIELYKAGKVNKILVSGAKDAGAYDEARAMQAELVDQGIPPEIILQDNLGLRTFESCKRAKTEFKLDSLLVISQGFHLPRALFLCNFVGIQVSGIYAVGKFSSYHSNWYNYREVAAMYVAVWDIIKYRSNGIIK